jgi:hypothetical protein
MPEITISADATLLSAAGYDRSAIMRAAVALARQFIADAGRCYRNKYSAQLRYGQPVPALVLPTWREAMSEALTIIWRKAREERAMAPAIAAEIERVEIAILTSQCAERITIPERLHLSALQARVVELRTSIHA